VGVDERKLQWAVGFAYCELPKEPESLQTLVTQVLRLPEIGPPPPPPAQWYRWLWDLRRESRAFVEHCYALFREPDEPQDRWLEGDRQEALDACPFPRDERAGAESNHTSDTGNTDREFLIAGCPLPSVPMEGGRRRFQIHEGKLVPVYTVQSQKTAFLNALAELFMRANLAKLERCNRRSGGGRCTHLFYRVRRQRFCGLDCRARAHPSATRARHYRTRRRSWQSCSKQGQAFRQDFEAMRVRRRARKAYTVPEFVKEVRAYLLRAQVELRNAFPAGRGKEFEAGRQLLAELRDQVTRLARRGAA
jgi:hypothetical protein